MTHERKIIIIAGPNGAGKTLSLPTTELAIARVAARVSQAGHAVSEADIRRRFKAGLDNFERIYQPLVDGWVLYDNSGLQPVLAF